MDICHREIDYEKLIIYHCKNNHENSLLIIKNVYNFYNDNDTILIIALIYNNIKVIDWLLTNGLISSVTLDKLFKKMCHINNIEILFLIKKNNYFKYNYEIIDNKVHGVINIVCMHTNNEYNDVCCICYEETECTTSCHHELCISCLKLLYQHKRKCPMCTKNIDFCYIYNK